IIADEPTTALDVTVQAQILQLIRRLAQERGIGVMLVTHDMGVIAQITDRVAVMQGGKLVELGPTRQVLAAPQHPYSRALISVVPRLDQPKSRFPVAGLSKDIDRALEWLAGEGQGRPSVSAGAQATPLVELRGVTQIYGGGRGLFSNSKGFLGLDAVDLSI